MTILLIYDISYSYQNSLGQSIFQSSIIILKFNVQMKKMNRSQSSYRQCKTLITEDDQQQMLAKYATKNYATRNPNLGSNSFIETNKENNSLFQSISQRNFMSKDREEVSEFQANKDQSKFYQQRCRKYEQEIKKLHRERQAQYHSTNNLNASKNYNYTEQMYSSEIDQLKSQLMKKERELEFYRQEYSMRNEQVQSISSEFSSKIEKDQKDKNLFVKQINSKQIQINSLQQKVKCHKSEIETLKIYLAEKDCIISELDDKLGQVDMKKKKIQSYQLQLKSSNQFLKELQSCTQRLKEEADQKDAIINQKRNDIMQLELTIQSYEDKLRSIEESLLKISQERKILNEKNQDLQNQLYNWRNSYDQLLRKNESIQQYELKLKAYISMVDQLNKSKTELISSNQKYKIAYTTIEKTLMKHQDMEKNLNQLKKQLKEKNDKIQELQDQDRNRRHIEEYNSRLRKEKDQLFTKWQDKGKECKTLISQLEEMRAKYKHLQEQLREINENNNRIKERSQKLDIVMKQNSQLNETILKKVDQIQKLQNKLNSLQNLFKNLQNDYTKQMMENQEHEQENRGLRIEIDDIRTRYEAETNVRILTEDKLVRSNQEIMALKFTITKYEEEASALREEIESMADRNEKEMSQIQNTIETLQECKRQSDVLLKESNTKIIELRRQVEDCRKGLEESYRKERTHMESIRTYQEQLILMRKENERLQERKRQMAEDAQKIKEFSEHILKLHLN